MWAVIFITRMLNELSEQSGQGKEFVETGQNRSSTEAVSADESTNQKHIGGNAPTVNQRAFDMKLNGGLELLRRVFSTIKKFSDEAAFSVEASGLRYRAMDASHVSLLDLFIPRGAFEEFRCEDPPVRFSVKTQDVIERLARGIGGQEDVGLSMDEEVRPEELRIMLVGSRNKEYTIKTLEDYGELVTLPKLDFSVMFSVESKSLGELLEDMAVSSERILIKTTSEKIEMSGESDSGRASTCITQTNTFLYRMECREVSEASYRIGPLAEFLDSMKPRVARIEYSSKMPIRIGCDLKNSGTEQGYCHLYLAPMIDD